MKPLALFYHVPAHLNPEFCQKLVADQLRHMAKSGLTEHLDQMLIGVNGVESECKWLQNLVPTKAELFYNEKEDWPAGEVPTLRYLREWLQAFPKHLVCYLHTKGLSHPPGSGGYQHRHDWRMRMEDVVIGRWRECVNHLENGHDTAGQWWNVAFNGSYWAGNFWWATGEYLATLPYIGTRGHNDGGRYEAELWIGRGPNAPRIASL